MKRRQFIGGIGGGVVLPALARAQAAKPTVGLLAGTKMDDWALPAIRKGLAEAGFADPQSVEIVQASADGQFDRLPALAEELVKRRVSVIVAVGSPVPARTAKAATTTIPIVFAYGGDPVADGLVATLGRPGGNVTGATFIGTALTAKRLELLAQLSDRIVDVGLLVNPVGTLAEGQIKEAQAAASTLKLRVQVVNCGSAGELDAAFAAIKKSSLDALLVGTDPLLGFMLREQIVAKAIQARLPTMWNARHDAEGGGLMSYGADLRGSWQQAGLYAGRILKGEMPADLPVQQATKFELVINLKTAKAIGIEIPQKLKLQADDQIE
jgi:putative ABC transport system substrate-binding protein